LFADDVALLASSRSGKLSARDCQSASSDFALVHKQMLNLSFKGFFKALTNVFSLTHNQFMDP